MLCNFEYHTPTKLIFGEGSLDKLPEVLSRFGKRILLVYGGGSIHRIGLYAKLMSILLPEFEVFELRGIQQNPKYEENVKKGVELCKRNKIDIVLAVGGGSVIDCAKSICAGALYGGEVWDLICGKEKALKALPLVTVLTLAATGTEFNNGSVISRPETHDKICYKDEHIYPVASFLDPVVTYSVSLKQTAAGIVDGFSHVLEQYFCEEFSDLTNGMCETIMRCLIKNAEAVIRNPDDYCIRGEIMLSCTLACNGILSLGNSQSGWPCHAIEHALSGFYDIVHGEGLAIIIPAWMKYILGKKSLSRFVNYGKNVWGLEGNTETEIAEKAIKHTVSFFTSLGLPQKLNDIGIGTEQISAMARHIALTEGLEGAWIPLNEDDILNILQSCV